jgi:alpha-L-rhamnosidase
VRPLAPGYSKVEIKPQPGPLTHFELSMPTVKGPVHANVSQAFGIAGELAHFKLQAIVPGNVAATMHVPRKGDGAPCVVLNGRETRASVSEQGAHVFVEVESGAHTAEWCA